MAPHRTLRAITLLALLGLLLAALAGTVQAKESLQDLVRDLGGKDGKARGVAYRELCARRDPAALPILRKALPAWNHTAQYYGVLIIGRYPPRTARRTWRILLEAEAPFVRLWAATALLRQGDEDATETIVAALTAPDIVPSTRVLMLRRLGWRLHPRVLEGVRALLKPAHDKTVLVQVFHILYRERDRKAAPFLGRLLRDARPGVKAIAATLLYDLGQTARAKELAVCLRGGIAYAEFTLVARILSANRRVTDEILDAATERLAEETNVTLITQQMTFLGRFRHAKARPVLRKLIQHKTESVARAAFDLLVEMSGPVREDTLKPLLDGDDVERKLWAAEALRRRDDLTGIGAVLDVLRSGNVPQRAAAAGMLADYVEDRTVEPLLSAMLDDHMDVRAAAFKSLSTLLWRLFPYRWFDLPGTGYTARADVATREKAVTVIRKWWEATRNEDW